MVSSHTSFTDHVNIRDKDIKSPFPISSSCASSEYYPWCKSENLNVGNNSNNLASSRWSRPVLHLMCMEKSYWCKQWLRKGQWGHNTKIFLWRQKKKQTKKTAITQKPWFLSESKSAFCPNTGWNMNDPSWWIPKALEMSHFEKRSSTSG